jgi:biotin synthase-related radical SAM superfamily protein
VGGQPDNTSYCGQDKIHQKMQAQKMFFRVDQNRKMAVTYGERKFKKINGGGHMKAISIYVYKSSLGDCTNGGISAKYKTILLEHPR